MEPLGTGVEIEGYWLDGASPDAARLEGLVAVILAMAGESAHLAPRAQQRMVAFLAEAGIESPADFRDGEAALTRMQAVADKLPEGRRALSVGGRIAQASHQTKQMPRLSLGEKVLRRLA